MSSIDHTLAALAEPTRRRVIELLRKGPRRAGDLADAVEVSAPLMSRHLRVLRLHGLIVESHANPQDTRIRMYQLRREPFDELANWVRAVEAFWSDQLGAFRDHIERKKGSK